MDVPAAAVRRVDPYNLARREQPGPTGRAGLPEPAPPPRYAGGVTKPTFCIRNSSVGLMVEPTTFFCIR